MVCGGRQGNTKLTTKRHNDCATHHWRLFKPPENEKFKPPENGGCDANILFEAHLDLLQPSDQGGLDKQFLLSQQFKYYPRLFEAAFAKK